MTHIDMDVCVMGEYAELARKEELDREFSQLAALQWEVERRDWHGARSSEEQCPHNYWRMRNRSQIVYIPNMHIDHLKKCFHMSRSNLVHVFKYAELLTELHVRGYSVVPAVEIVKVPRKFKKFLPDDR